MKKSEKVTLQKYFGEALAKARKRVGISQEKLAMEAELDRTYISLLERGLRQPTLSTIFVLADVLNIKPSSMTRSVESKRKSAS